MEVVIMQRNLVWGEPELNRKRADEAFERNPGADLYVLPEMFTTGFATSADSKIDSDHEATLEWMQEHARKGDCAVAGSIAMSENGRCFNRFYFVTPQGVAAQYDKRHLFLYGGEGERFNAGNERVVVSFRGFRFLLTVCYDLRFPVWSRNRSDYDVMLCVANWPTPRQQAWDTLLVARAIENQAYVIGVNRVGEDPVCHYTGGSAIIDPFGVEMVRCENGKECEVRAKIGLAGLEDFRKKFPVLESADRFVIE